MHFKQIIKLLKLVHIKKCFKIGGIFLLGSSFFHNLENTLHMVTSYSIAGMELRHGIFSLWEEIPNIFLIFIVVFPNFVTILSLFWVDNLPTN